ncbi:kynurenine formamidase [Agromyces flavus]|uniref:Kynurenine formamidase n=1 Tax=Agromyces flavus TaxID=589382 RepID=A0A1H1VR77_9MICO|nr:cyclase family protein [Agromyces flavus]MCP2365995.1 kynurenine formamidase [Agromyces flavus]GGI43789.1 cyclase [Agromyces flavus]SDS87454.1 Kynurenine formamidase [Agromyces flavus]
MRDLSHPIADGMMVYPGDPGVHLAPALELERDGAAVTSVRMGSHTGTHVDAPAHTVAGGRTMDAVGLDELVGDALVIRVAGLEDRATVGVADLGDLPERVPAIVVLDTGWAAHFGSERALRHPALSAEAARELVDRGMRVLAVDTLSPDPTDAAGTTDFPVHEIVLGADGLIVENLANLDGLPPRVRIGIFPVRLGTDGAPVRAVAFDA